LKTEYTFNRYVTAAALAMNRRATVPEIENHDKDGSVFLGRLQDGILQNATTGSGYNDTSVAKARSAE
jgi:hypothetical protein